VVKVYLAASYPRPAVRDPSTLGGGNHNSWVCSTLQEKSVLSSPSLMHQITLMHVGRSSVPFSWVGCDAPHPAVNLIADNMHADTDARLNPARDVAGHLAFSTVVYCRRGRRRSEARLPSSARYTMFGSIYPCRAANSIFRYGTHRGRQAREAFECQVRVRIDFIKWIMNVGSCRAVQGSIGTVWKYLLSTRILTMRCMHRCILQARGLRGCRPAIQVLRWRTECPMRFQLRTTMAVGRNVVATQQDLVAAHVVQVSDLGGSLSNTKAFLCNIIE
jgi:hypothetical protein